MVEFKESFKNLAVFSYFHNEGWYNDILACIDYI